MTTNNQRPEEEAISALVNQALADGLAPALADRIPEVVAMFAGPDPDVANQTPKVIACLNVDDPHNFLIGGKQVVTINHTKTICGCCGDQVWIGAKQRELAEAGGGIVTCYLCVVVFQRLSGQHEQEVTSLDPHADQLPRMFTKETRVKGTPLRMHQVTEPRAVIVVPRVTEPRPDDTTGKIECASCGYFCWMNELVYGASATGDALAICTDCEAKARLKTLFGGPAST